jgi:hypothetical protein
MRRSTKGAVYFTQKSPAHPAVPPRITEHRMDDSDTYIYDEMASLNAKMSVMLCTPEEHFRRELNKNVFAVYGRLPMRSLEPIYCPIIYDYSHKGILEHLKTHTSKYLASYVAIHIYVHKATHKLVYMNNTVEVYVNRLHCKS